MQTVATLALAMQIPAIARVAQTDGSYIVYESGDTLPPEIFGAATGRVVNKPTDPVTPQFQIGEADWTGAIQRAANTGRPLLFMDEEYSISAAIDFPHFSGRKVIGSGRGQTTIKQMKDNTPIFLLSGTRMVFKNIFFTWENVQTSAHPRSSAIKCKEKTTPGSILATSRFENIGISRCAKGFDLANAIGYSLTFRDINVSSFAISALYTDAQTAFTQLDFGSWHVNNQPKPYRNGLAVGGTTSTIVLQSNHAETEQYYKGMPIVITTGANAAGTVRWITDYDVETRTATFLPAAASPMDQTSAYQIAQIAESSEAPIRLIGVTDFRWSSLALEFIRLTPSNPAPIYVESCQVGRIDLVRYERIAWQASNSALILAAGRTHIGVGAVQSQYNAALTQLGCTTFYYGRTNAQAVIEFDNIERDQWQVTSAARWALASAANSGSRSERPYGGVVFNSIPSGDSNLSASGQAFDFAGARRQTGILGRPSAEKRGASVDEGAGTTYSHNLMDRPDVVRFNTPLTADINFVLDTGNIVAGATVTVVRGPNATGDFSILIKEGATTRATLSAPNTKAALVMDGVNYYVLP